MKLPPQNPLFNIIKDLCDYFDQRKAEKQPKLKEHMLQVPQDVWNNIPMGYINIPKRITAIRVAKFWHTED